MPPPYFMPQAPLQEWEGDGNVKLRYRGERMTGTADDVAWAKAGASTYDAGTSFEFPDILQRKGGEKGKRIMTDIFSNFCFVDADTGNRVHGSCSKCGEEFSTDAALRAHQSSAHRRYYLDDANLCVILHSSSCSSTRLLQGI